MFGVVIARTFAWVVPIALAALLVGCEWGNSTELRYRVTIEVDTPVGVRSGSSVWSFTLRPGGLTSAYNSEFSGEAIVVDLPGGRALYGLLVGGDENEVFHGIAQMLPENVHRRVGLTPAIERETLGDRMRVLRYIRQLPRRRIELDCTSFPPSECLKLIHFRNPADPATIEAVARDDLEQTFGAGTRLRRVTLEITDDSPSFNLQERLPWLHGSPERRLRHPEGIRDRSLPALLSHGAFQRR